MKIIYSDEIKALPCEALHRLFENVGWSDGNITNEMLNNFNRPFINSTLVVSAWDGTNLIGVVRVLSDQLFRSVIYDLAIDTDYQSKGIGSELVKRCMRHYPKSEWLVGTTHAIAGYYEKIGFKRVNSNDVYLTVPCQWFDD